MRCTPSEEQKREALWHFKNHEDTRLHRDVLRAYNIDGMTDREGRWRNVPTVEEEEAGDAPSEAGLGHVPKVWKSSPH